MPTIDLRFRAVRNLDEPPIPFILNSWLKSYRWSDSDNLDYYRDLVPQIKNLIKTSRVVVASLEEESDCFVGWICCTSGLLHYVYVKSAFRRCGVAKELIKKVCGSYGEYTFKSRNNAFLRYLDEKGFEYVKDDKRDKVDMAKDPGTKYRRQNGVKGPGSIIARPIDNPGTRGSVDHIDQNEGCGTIHPVEQHLGG